MRDYQRKRVYDAERRVSVFTENAVTKQEPTVDWVVLQKYVLDITKTSWFQKRWPRRTIEVWDGRAHRSARGGWGWITMPRWSWSPLIILHEIAHAVGDWISDKHGPTYCGHYLYLVYHQLGPAIYLELRNAFLSNGVDFKNPLPEAAFGIREYPKVNTVKNTVEIMKAKPKRKPNLAAIEALRKYREQKKISIEATA